MLNKFANTEKVATIRSFHERVHKFGTRVVRYPFFMLTLVR